MMMTLLATAMLAIDANGNGASAITLHAITFDFIIVIVIIAAALFRKKPPHV